MRSMFVFAFAALLVIHYSLGHAEANANRIKFEGIVIDGPFIDTVVDGYCKRKSRGDEYLQLARCVVTLSNGYRIVDPNASVEVVGDNRALRIIVGPGMDDEGRKGNFKLSNFEVTTYFDREISLYDIPRSFKAVEMSLGGVSIAAGASTTSPDYLIWDIAGDGVF